MSDEVKTKSEKSSLLKSSSGMALATFLSRLLGVVRVRLESAVLGGGEVASGWFIAFAIPNLLRRVLGEGAIGSALIPLIAENHVKDGEVRMRRQLAVIFGFLTLLLTVIVVAVSLGTWAIERFSPEWGIGFFEHKRIRIVLNLLPILMPYALFICMTGVVSAVLNYAKIFLRPALAALLLNIALLAGLSAALYWSMPETEFLPMLSFIVPAAGILQLLLVVIFLYKSGLFPVFKGCCQEKGVLRKLFKLALPGILGYSALQLSFFIDRMMAASLGSQAVPALNYVDRIVDIPIGIVAVSLGNVLMSLMSRSAAAGNRDEIADTLAYSLRMVWFITLPLAAFVVFFHNNMLHVLCLGGRYTADDMSAAHWVAIFYGTGIPFFCSIKVIYPAFYARQKMVAVLKVSVCATVLNIIMNYILMQFLAQGGIALATVIASLFNNAVLLWLLSREKMTPDVRKVIGTLVRSTAAAFLPCWGMFLLHEKLLYSWTARYWLNEIWFMAGAGIIFAGFYILLSKVLRSPECRELAGMLKRRLA